MAMQIKTVLLTSLLLITSHNAQSQDFTEKIFGPETVVRGVNKPKTIPFDFSVPQPDRAFQLVVENGLQQDVSCSGLNLIKKLICIVAKAATEVSRVSSDQPGVLVPLHKFHLDRKRL